MLNSRLSSYFFTFHGMLRAKLDKLVLTVTQLQTCWVKHELHKFFFLLMLSMFLLLFKMFLSILLLFMLLLLLELFFELQQRIISSYWIFMFITSKLKQWFVCLMRALFFVCCVWLLTLYCFCFVTYLPQKHCLHHFHFHVFMLCFFILLCIRFPFLICCHGGKLLSSYKAELVISRIHI